MIGYLNAEGELVRALTEAEAPHEPLPEGCTLLDPLPEGIAAGTHYWDAATQSAIEGAAPDYLAAAKAARIDALAERRWRAEQNFSFNGSPLTLDDGTQRRIAGAIQYLAISGEASVRWQVVRGVFVTLTAAELTALGIAAGAHVQACFANVETIAGLIEAAEDEAAVAAIDLDAGWPG